MKKVTKKRRKLNLKKLLTFLIVTFLIIYTIIKIVNLKITNIYIYNNNILSDQEIIDLAGISDYPKSINNPTWTIEKNIEKSVYIKSVKVTKEKLTIIKIEVEENIPLFYNDVTKKVVLDNKKEVDKEFDVPKLLNFIPNDIYDEFINKMINVKSDILNRISEIKYDPNELDKERFLLIMKDGNYVYITLNRFETINNYVSIIKKFDNKKGILKLDAGNVFEYFD